MVIQMFTNYFPKMFRKNLRFITSGKSIVTNVRCSTFIYVDLPCFILRLYFTKHYIKFVTYSFNPIAQTSLVKALNRIISTEAQLVNKTPLLFISSSQDLFSNSSYYLPYSSFDVSVENLAFVQLIIPSMIFPFILNTFPLDIIVLL